MEEYKEILEILYDVKDVIPEGKYIKLNNLVLKLYKDAKSNKNNSYPEEEEHSTDIPRIIDEKWEEIEQIDIGNMGGKITSIISTIEYFEQSIECTCEQNDPIFICNANRRSLFNCKNFQRFVDKNANIINLIDRRKQMSLVNIPNHDTILNFSNFKVNIFNHINLIKNLVLAQDRCIIIISMFDYIMRNIESLRYRPILTMAFIRKIDQFKENATFMSFMEMNKYDPERWKIFLQQILL